MGYYCGAPVSGKHPLTYRSTSIAMPAAKIASGVRPFREMKDEIRLEQPAGNDPAASQNELARPGGSRIAAEDDYLMSGLVKSASEHSSNLT